MDILDFARTAGAVILGNFLTLIVVYTVWRASKLEKAGLSADQLPFWLLLAVIIPFAVVAWSALTAG